MSGRRRTIIFGASQGGVYTLKHLRKRRRELEVVAFCDNSSAKHGQTLARLPVIAPKDLRAHQPDLILVASSYRHEIRDQLVSLGFSPDEFDTIPPEVLQGEVNMWGCYLPLMLVVTGIALWLLV